MQPGFSSTWSFRRRASESTCSYLLLARALVSDRPHGSTSAEGPNIRRRQGFPAKGNILGILRRNGSGPSAVNNASVDSPGRGASRTFRRGGRVVEPLPARREKVMGTPSSYPLTGTATFRTSLGRTYPRTSHCKSLLLSPCIVSNNHHHFRLRATIPPSTLEAKKKETIVLKPQGNPSAAPNQWETGGWLSAHRAPLLAGTERGRRQLEVCCSASESTPFYIETPWTVLRVSPEGEPLGRGAARHRDGYRGVMRFSLGGGACRSMIAAQFGDRREKLRKTSLAFDQVQRWGILVAPRGLAKLGASSAEIPEKSYDGRTIAATGTLTIPIPFLRSPRLPSRSHLSRDSSNLRLDHLERIDNVHSDYLAVHPERHARTHTIPS